MAELRRPLFFIVGFCGMVVTFILYDNSSANRSIAETNLLNFEKMSQNRTYRTSVSTSENQYQTSIPGATHTTTYEPPYTRTYTTPRVWNISNLPTLDKDLDNLRLPEIRFLDNFKNPCWIEEIPSADYLKHYEENIVATVFKELRSNLKRSASIYEKIRIEKGQTWRVRCLPYYYIIGVSKCGTSDLSSIVSRHPRVVAPPRKEITYWNRIRYTTPQPVQNPKLLANLAYLQSRDTWPLKHYIDIFDSTALDIGRDYAFTQKGHEAPYFDKITGDATPNYIWDLDGWRKIDANRGLREPKVILAHLIKMVTPMAKIIVIVRNPTGRAWSEYMYYQKGEQKSPELFHGFVTRAIDVWNNCLLNNTGKFCAYDQKTNTQTMPVRLRLGLYYLFIRDWLEVFGLDQFLLLRLEDWTVARTAAVNHIFKFLDMEPLDNNIDEVGIRNSNKKRQKMQMLRKTEVLLDDFYKPWNKKLATLMKDDTFNYGVP